MAADQAFPKIAISSLLAEVKQLSVLAQRLISPDDQDYVTRLQTYFSQQEQDIRPAGIITPQSTKEVSELIKIIAKHHGSSSAVNPCFAVKSGGKTPWPESSNIQAGLTIDLGALNAIVPAADRQTVRIGPGNKWGDVYLVLDAKKLGISGGRDATVGVGGLTLGGGLSFFGPQRGFVCDDVSSFEVVLADGSIVKASRDSHSDLFKALKGGSGNFGIVTSYEFMSFDLGDIWGGQNVYPIDTAPKHLDALYNFAANPTPDPHASVIQSYAVYQGSVIVNEGLMYTKPVEKPPVFSEFLAIEPCVYSSNKITNMTAAAIEESGFNVNGRRVAMMNIAIVNDRDLLGYAFDAWNASVSDVKHIPNISWALTLQPLTPVMTQKSQEYGGNVLGLEGAPPLINTQIYITWDKMEDDHLVEKALRILEDISDEAKSRSLFHRFVYLNYAWSSQDPIGGYGPANQQFLQEVSKKYDPNGLFQSGIADVATLLRQLYRSGDWAPLNLQIPPPVVENLTYVEAHTNSSINSTLRCILVLAQE